MNNENLDCIGEWGDWGRCSHKCNTGVQSRKYNVIYPGSNGNSCPFEHNDIQYKDCNTHKCTPKCIVGDWGGWGECSELCGGGLSKRIRKILPPSYINFRYDTPNKEYNSCINKQILETYYEVGPEEFNIPEISDTTSNGVGRILKERPKYKNKHGYVIVFVRLDDTYDEMVILTHGSEKNSRILDFSNILAKLGNDNMIWGEINKEYKHMDHTNIFFHSENVDANSSSKCVSMNNTGISFFEEEGIKMEIRNISSNDLKDIPEFTKQYCTKDVIYEEYMRCNVEKCAINKHEITNENDKYIEIILKKSRLSLRIPTDYNTFIRPTVFPRRSPGGPDLILYEEEDTLDLSLECSKTNIPISQDNCIEDDLYGCTKKVVSLDDDSNNNVLFNELIELFPNKSVSILSNYKKCNVADKHHYIDKGYNVKNCYDKDNKEEAEKNQSCILGGKNSVVLQRSLLTMEYPVNYRDINDIVISKYQEDNNTNLIVSDKNDQLNRECPSLGKSMLQYNCIKETPTNECILVGIETLNNNSTEGDIKLFEDLTEFFEKNRSIQIVSSIRQCAVPREKYYVDNESNVMPCSNEKYQPTEDINGYCKGVSDKDNSSGFMSTFLITILLGSFFILLFYLLQEVWMDNTKKSGRVPRSIKYKIK